MKLLKLSATLLLCAASALTARAQEGPLSLVPQPQSVTRGEGTFRFGKHLTAAADAYDGDSIRLVLNGFGSKLTAATSITIKAGKAGKAQLQLRRDASLGPEAYKLHINKKTIIVEAARPAGFFYALQTLQQLLPSRSVLAGKADAEVTAWTLPVVDITDAPRFGWRGFMLDEGRHFYGKEEVKKLLDVMAAYKLNRFHWHLTEDQGWRIEIKKYPRLTEVGAWRQSKVLGWGDVKPDGQHYGGFYTQDDAREIVRYARERFIEIVPEIDMPGHSQAAVAAYPDILACDPQEHHEVWLWQGVSTDVMNVANPKAIRFACDVIDELTDVFPFAYFHLGGDECPTQKWENNAQCDQLMRNIGAIDWRNLQTHFYHQLQRHMARLPRDKQRHLIFWNEVLHGNTAQLGKDVTIMAWVGADAAARKAAERGFNTILSPQIPYYINRRQSPLPTEPRSQGNGTETLEAVYNYVPMKNVPDALQPRYMGVQANFWTEWVEDAPTVQYLMFPRLAAVAEAGWTQQSLRSYDGFLQRLQQEPSFYRFSGVNYGKHVFEKH